MIFSSASAKFGFPEVKIGLLPGAGGTQRLTNAVGKFRVSAGSVFQGLVVWMVPAPSSRANPVWT